MIIPGPEYTGNVREREYLFPRIFWSANSTYTTMIEVYGAYKIIIRYLLKKSVLCNIMRSSSLKLISVIYYILIFDLYIYIVFYYFYRMIIIMVLSLKCNYYWFCFNKKE